MTWTEYFVIIIVVLIFIVVFQIAKASEYVSVLKGEKKAFEQNNRINAFLMLALLIPAEVRRSLIIFLVRIFFTMRLLRLNSSTPPLSCFLLLLYLQPASFFYARKYKTGYLAQSISA